MADLLRVKLFCCIVEKIPQLCGILYHSSATDEYEIEDQITEFATEIVDEIINIVRSEQGEKRT